jgi:hypothetical protein
VQVFPPVDVIRTVVAVTAPVVLAGPNALTQSPTANAVDVVAWVSDRVVVDAVVIFSFSVFTDGFFLAALLDLLVEALSVWLSTVPDSDTVVPETAVTLPLANVKLPPPNAPPAPPEVRLGKLPPGGVPVPPPVRPAPPPNPPNPPRAPAPNPPAPPGPAAHVPDDVGLLIVMDRAATVVLDFFDGVPVTVRQSPTATALTVSVAVSENVVLGVQLTAVCPAVGLCTCIVVPEMEATLPLAPAPVGAVAAPAAAPIPRTTVVQSAAIPAGTAQRPRRRLWWRVVSMRAFSFVVSIIYSLRRASMGARWAARLAG